MKCKFRASCWHLSSRHIIVPCCTSYALIMMYYTLPGLASEQKALLDFLVLTKADRYVGFGSSTFSFYLQQYRLLQGFPETSSVLVNASVITTDSMFEAAGVVSH